MRWRYSIDLLPEHVAYEGGLITPGQLGAAVAEKVESSEPFRSVSRGILGQLTAAFRGVISQEDYVLVLGRLYDWGDTVLSGEPDEGDENAERLCWIQTTQ